MASSARVVLVLQRIGLSSTSSSDASCIQCLLQIFSKRQQIGAFNKLVVGFSYFVALYLLQVLFGNFGDLDFIQIYYKICNKIQGHREIILFKLFPCFCFCSLYIAYVAVSYFSILNWIKIFMDFSKLENLFKFECA